MFFHLKTAIMKKAVAKRNKNAVFDYAAAERFSLKSGDDAMVNNSYYFSAHSENKSVYFRLGLRNCFEETWFVFYDNGKRYDLSREVFEKGASPLKIEFTGKEWKATFSYPLVDETGAEHDCRFSAVFNSDKKPVNFSSDMPAVRVAKAMSQEKWGKKFFTEVRKINGQTHYEQEGTLTGEIVIDGNKTDFSMPCVRDHSFGRRDWNYMNNHLWIAAVSLKGQINYSMVSYPALSFLEVGNFRLGKEEQEYMEKADCELSAISKGTVPDKFEITVASRDKKIKISAKIKDTRKYSFQDGDYVLYENIAEYDVDGEKMRGIFEIGFNKEKERWFNGRDIGSFVR